MSNNLTLWNDISEVKQVISNSSATSIVPDIPQIVAALATVQCRTIEQIYDEMASNGGDIRVSVAEMKAVGAIIEEQCGRELLHPSDFGTEKTLGNTKTPNRASNNRCMDAAEDTTLVGIANVIRTKMAQ